MRSSPFAGRPMTDNWIRKWDPASSDRAGLCRGWRCGIRKRARRSMRLG